MTRLRVSKPASGTYAIFGPPLRIATMDPVRALQRVDRALSWLMGQPAPHEVVLDDPSGIGAALIVGWVLTADYPCSVTLIASNGRKVVVVGIFENGHAFVTALAGSDDE